MDAVISPQRVAEQAFQQESGEEDSKERKENAAQQEAVRVPDAGQSANEETCSTLTKTTGPESSASGAGTKRPEPELQDPILDSPLKTSEPCPPSGSIPLPPPPPPPPPPSLSSAAPGAISTTTAPPLSPPGSGHSNSGSEIPPPPPPSSTGEGLESAPAASPPLSPRMDPSPPANSAEADSQNTAEASSAETSTIIPPTPSYDSTGGSSEQPANEKVGKSSPNPITPDIPSATSEAAAPEAETPTPEPTDVDQTEKTIDDSAPGGDADGTREDQSKGNDDTDCSSADAGVADQSDASLPPAGPKQTDQPILCSGDSSSSGEDEKTPCVRFPTAEDGAESLKNQFKVSEQTKLENKDTFNPFQLVSKASIRQRNKSIAESLKFNAVELSVECDELCRLDLFARSDPYVVLFSPGTEMNSWQEWDRTEVMRDSRSPRFVKKIRIPAGTEIDRESDYKVCLYNHNENVSELLEQNMLGQTTFKIDELLTSPQMTKQVPLRSPRSGRPKGLASLSLDMILHMDLDEQVTFDFGFTESAPVRNRVVFVISRALKKGCFSPVYRSEVQTKESLSKFDDVTLSSQELHGGDPSRLFRLEVYRYYRNGRTILLGFVQTTLEKLKTMKPGTQLYWWPALNGFPRVHFKFVSSKIEGTQSWFVMRLTD